MGSPSGSHQEQQFRKPHRGYFAHILLFLLQVFLSNNLSLNCETFIYLLEKTQNEGEREREILLNNSHPKSLNDQGWGPHSL